MARLIKPLTDTQCKNARFNPAGGNKLFDGNGLYLELMPTGSKLWRHKYRRLNGSENRLSYGPYPEVSLLVARGKRDEARALLRENKDPAVVRDQMRVEATISANTTFEAVAREWFDLQKPKWVPRHAQNIIARLQNDIFTEIGGMPVSEITPLQMLETVRKIEHRGAHDVARRTLQISRQVFSYAITTNRARTNPAANVNSALKPYKKGHFAAITAKEIPDFLKALNSPDVRCTRITRLATKLLMLTFVRTNELIKAKWPEFNLNKAEWLIGADRMKMKRDHIVPLSTQALSILKELREMFPHAEYVLPNVVRPKKHMSEATILNTLKRMGYEGRMTGHGFRALAMTTIKEDLGYPHEVIDRQLAHAPTSKLGRAYDRTEFLKERRAMMQAWADYIDGVSEVRS